MTLSSYLITVKDTASQHYDLFRESPVKYTASSVGNFVKNYWDLGAMVLAGYAFNDYNNETFGEMRFPIMLASGIAGIAGSANSNDRLARNFYAGFASLFYFWANGIDVPDATRLGNQTVGGLMAFGSAVMDKYYRTDKKQIRQETKTNVKSETLEDAVNA